jgi:iron complex transport system ATP-binding protein
MISLSDIRVVRGGRAILDGVNLSVVPGRLLGIVGPNGAGKSTLLRVMATILEADSGTVAIDNVDGNSLSARDRARRIAYLPQHPECHWAMSAERVVALGRLPHLSLFQGPGPADRTAVRTAMADTDILDLAARPMGTLSGGEFARVMLARALASDPGLLLADEPVADLDPYHSLEVMDHLRRLTAAGRTVVVVLHDLTLAARYCTDIALLNRGRIVAEGSPEETLSAANLAGVYRITALHGAQDGKSYLLPWSRLSESRLPDAGGTP